VLARFASPREFHQFVLAGNAEALKEYYARGRQSPVLGGEGFRERLLARVSAVSREYPRYERAAVRVAPEKVLAVVAQAYGKTREELLQARRGRENRARKVGMYLVRRLCDLTLPETANLFGVGSYGVVGWACHGVRSMIESDRTFQKTVDRIQSVIVQQKT
jgi:Bacterial dnaA protein helix-turn-helix